MSRAIPYRISIRDPEHPGAAEGEHEVVFTTGEPPHVQGNVVRLDDGELLDLACAALGRIHGVPHLRDGFRQELRKLGIMVREPS